MRSVHHLSMQSVRMALDNLPSVTKAKRPLLSENLKVFEKSLLYDKPAHGKSARQILDISRHIKHRQSAIPEVVDIWANRVLRHSGKAVAIFPWRYWNTDSESKPVQIDPAVMSGRLVVTGTRIPVSILVGRRATGESTAAIAADYRLAVDRIEKALRHVDKKAA